MTYWAGPDLVSSTNKLVIFIIDVTFILNDFDVQIILTFEEASLEHMYLVLLSN